MRDDEQIVPRIRLVIGCTTGDRRKTSERKREGNGEYEQR